MHFCRRQSPLPRYPRTTLCPLTTHSLTGMCCKNSSSFSRLAQRHASAFAPCCCRRAEASTSPRYSRGEAAAAAETRSGVCRGEREPARRSPTPSSCVPPLAGTTALRGRSISSSRRTATRLAPVAAGREHAVAAWHRGPEPDSRTVERLRDEALTHTGHAAQGTAPRGQQLRVRAARSLVARMYCASVDLVRACAFITQTVSHSQCDS